MPPKTTWALVVAVLALHLACVAEVSAQPVCSCPVDGTFCDNTCSPSNGFASYTPGNINGQNGWTTQDSFTFCQSPVGPWDQAIVDVNGKRVWRVSNAIASTSYSSQPFSYVSPAVAGETGASLFNDRGNCGCNPPTPPLCPVGSTVNNPPIGASATTTKFYMRTDFRSATRAPQPGLSVGLSASAKQSAVRMTNLRINDNGSGFDLVFTDTAATAPSSGSVTFPFTTIASGLSYTDLHRLEVTIEFVDGINDSNPSDITGNDIVKVYLNGNLIHTGTTWEVYYSYTELFNAPNRRLQAVNSLLVRLSGTAAPSLSSYGLLFEEVKILNCADIEWWDNPPCCVPGSGLCCTSDGTRDDTTVCRNATQECRLPTVCDGMSVSCPAQEPGKPNGTPCKWHPRQSSRQHDYSAARVESVPAHVAAGWLASEPQYKSEPNWPACEGICLFGHCALPWETPGCCYVRRHHHHGEYDGPSKEWFCWGR